MKLKPKLRASRIVAICRIALTLALILTFTSYAALNTPAGYLALGSYLAFGLAMLVIAWRHWWLNHQLRVIGPLVDTCASQVAIRTRAPILLMGTTGAGTSQLARLDYELDRYAEREGERVTFNKGPDR